MKSYSLVKTNKSITLATFFGLYVAQSVPMSFFTTALQVLMRQADFSLTSIALMQLIKLPWILKFLWSPLVDRRCISTADYKRFIIRSEMVYALLILVIGFLDINTNIQLILLLLICSFVASASQDIATDALAILTFRSENKGMINSMQAMGSFGGALIGSGVLLMILHQFGWRTVTVCMCMIVMVVILPLKYNKGIQAGDKSETVYAKRADFIWFFSQKGIWRQVCFLILYYSSFIGILSILRPYLVDLGYGLKEIGFMSGIFGTAVAFVAAYPAGKLIKKFGCNTIRIWVAVLILVSTLYFMQMSYTHPTKIALYIGIMLLWSSYGMGSVVVYTSAMDCVRAGREGTDFTVQTVLAQLSGIIVASVSGLVADRMGYSGLFAMELALAFVSLIFIAIFFKNKKSKNAKTGNNSKI